MLRGPASTISQSFFMSDSGSGSHRRTISSHSSGPPGILGHQCIRLGKKKKKKKHGESTWTFSTHQRANDEHIVRCLWARLPPLPHPSLPLFFFLPPSRRGFFFGYRARFVPFFLFSSSVKHSFSSSFTYPPPIHKMVIKVGINGFGRIGTLLELSLIHI